MFRLKNGATIAVAVIACAGLSSFGVFAQPDSRPPVQVYRGDAQFATNLCSLKFQLNQARGEGLPVEGGESDYSTCIREQATAVKKSYDGAARTVKKTAAKKALQEHYIAAITQLRGIAPKTGEIRMHYTARQSQNEARVEEAWTRFEVEQ